MKYRDWVNSFAGDRWCQVLTVLMRMVIGGVFAFSGYAKAIDPWGTYYKVSEYLAALDWTSLQPVAQALSFALGPLELVLGVCLVVGAFRRGVPVLLLLMMCVMTPLTLWSAVTGAVPDCGCFGEALRLTPWATFGKNLLLVLGLLFLLVTNRHTTCLYGPAVQWVVVALTALLGIFVATRGQTTQPLIDYRPYQVGARMVPSAVSTDDDEYIFIYERNGEQRPFSLDSLPDEDEWTYVDRRRVLNTEGSKANRDSVPNVVLDAFDGSTNVSDEVLQRNPGGTLLLLFPDIKATSIASTFDINALCKLAERDSAQVYGLAAGTNEDVNEWMDLTVAPYRMYTNDDTQLKMVARGNPAVVYLDNENRIVWKRTLSSLDSDAIDAENAQLARLSDDFNPDREVTGSFFTYLVLMLALLVFNRTHVLVGGLWRRAHRKKTSTSDLGIEPAELPAETATEAATETAAEAATETAAEAPAEKPAAKPASEEGAKDEA